MKILESTLSFYGKRFVTILIAVQKLYAHKRCINISFIFGWMNKYMIWPSMTFFVTEKKFASVLLSYSKRFKNYTLINAAYYFTHFQCCSSKAQTYRCQWFTNADADADANADANDLPMPMICRCQWFADANDLQKPMMCQRKRKVRERVDFTLSRGFYSEKERDDFQPD